MPLRYVAQLGEEEIILTVAPNGTLWRVEQNNESFALDAAQIAPGHFSVLHNGKSYDVILFGENGAERAVINGRETPLELYEERLGAKSRSRKRHHGGLIKAPMPGLVIAVNVQVGDVVKRGQSLIVLEAMKMENDLTSPADASVTALYVAKGDKVERDAKLVELG
jgi:biotin carboxyl carrier protein